MYKWSVDDEITAARLNKNIPYIPFGGTGADGALAITTGTTTLDMGAAQVYIKNYTSISITGNGKLAFSNPHANGTIIILKSQGNGTLTSTTVPLIDASGMGAAGGTTSDSNGTNGTGIIDDAVHYGLSNAGTGAGGLILANKGFYTKDTYKINLRRDIYLAAGSGGAAGKDSTGLHGDGGRGGAGLLIECAGDINFPTGKQISAAGKNGVAGTSGGGGWGGSGGGGGAGGMILVVYNTATDIAGTLNNIGGAGGNGLGGGGGAGGVYGGGGGGSYGGAGGAGGNPANNPTNGNAAGGTSAGGGGAGGSANVGTGGAAGASDGLMYFQNV